MPDGTNASHIAVDMAIQDMHDKLVRYGHCWLRGGKGAARIIVKVKVRDEFGRVQKDEYGKDVEVEQLIRPSELYPDDPKKKKREWTQNDIDAAGRLHARVIRLPMRHAILLQVLYSDAKSEWWLDLMPDERLQHIRDLVNWNGHPRGINQRIADANKDRGTKEPPIHFLDFEGIWRRALQMLINAERMLP